MFLNFKVSLYRLQFRQNIESIQFLMRDRERDPIRNEMLQSAL